MGQITSGVGLISGIDTANLIDQLIAIETRPRQLLQRRNEVLRAQQVAIQAINAKLLSFKANAAGFSANRIFNATTAASTNESVLTATSSSFTTPGQYDFTVSRLVTSQQSISRGFADRDQTPLGEGDVTFEFGDGRLDTDTKLSGLNGGQGVQRGLIRITDRAGTTSVIDLRKSLTVNDVLNAINSDYNLNVIASVEGDSFVLTDTSTTITGSLAVSDVSGGTTATALGLAGTTAGDTLTGTQVNTIGNATLLSSLNDGLGVVAAGSVSAPLADFQVNLGDGSSFQVDLGTATTVGQVLDAINTAAAGSATAAVSDDGVGIKITDNTGGGGGISVTALNASTAANDLGLDIPDFDGDGVLQGDRIVAGLNSKLLKNLNGGTGVTYGATGGQTVLTGATLLSDLFGGAGVTTDGGAGSDIRIFAKDTHATSYTINVDPLTTVNDLIANVSAKTGGRVTLSIEGQQLRATDNTGGPLDLRILDMNGASVATELGLAVDGPVSTVLGNDVGLPNPPAVYGAGSIDITDRAGATTTINLQAARSVSDVIRLINDSGAAVRASLNTAGNGINITDASGGAGDLIVADADGTIAAELGIADTYADGVAKSGNLQFQYISEGTLLSRLNGGAGITRGRFTLTDSNGVSSTVDLTQGDEMTVGDVINEINSRGTAITARINDNGDGILLVDDGGGIVAMTVEDNGSTTARDLGIRGEAAAPGENIDGSFEKTISLDADDTLDDLVQKISDANINVRATVINDGSGAQPYRLSLLSSVAGKAGAFVFDDGGLDFGVDRLVEARDAVVFFGAADPSRAVAITSTTNTLNNVIPGTTISLNGASESPVTLTISKDTAGIIEAVNSFVEGFNGVVDELNKQDFYNAETQERGLLLGDNTVSQVRSGLFNLIINPNSELSSTFRTLSQVGITVGEGTKLEFNAEKFQAALDSDPDAVQQLFTLQEIETDDDGERTVTARGTMIRIDDFLRRMTDSIDGTVTQRVESIDSQVELNNRRIEDFNELLDLKRARLEAEFRAMENALAQLQSQSSALTQFQNSFSSQQR